MSAVMTDDWLPRHRFTVEEYYRMAEVGLLAPDARVELIEGEIIDMPPIGTLHGWTVDWLTRALCFAVGDRAILRVQGAVRLSRFSQPQPDIALLVPKGAEYKRTQPSGTDTALVIEVSDSTFRFDSKVKVPLYAKHGVPEVWLIDVDRGQLHFYRSLEGSAYRDVSQTGNPGSTPISALPGITVDLSRLLSS